MSDDIQQRKNDHLRLGLEKDVSSSLATGLERLHFVHQALPEIDLADIDTTQQVFNRQLQTPLIIASMTGGTRLAADFNHRLAEAAQATGIGMGIGSQRAAIEDASVAESFQVRHLATVSLNASERLT